VFRWDGTDWRSTSIRLARQRAAHTTVATGPDSFVVIGGTTYEGDQADLEIESCVLDDGCTVIGQLARQVELARVAAAPDGSLVVGDTRYLQLVSRDGTTAQIDGGAFAVVETAAGVAVLGIDNGKDTRTNLPLPRRHAILSGATTGLQPIATPPEGNVTAAVAIDDHRVLVPGAKGSSVLDVRDGTWTAAPALPSASFVAMAVALDGGGALVAGDGLFRFDDATGWTAVTGFPRGYEILSATRHAGGALLLLSTDRYEGEPTVLTVTFRAADGAWILGGPAMGRTPVHRPITSLPSGAAVLSGGANIDFIAGRSAS
jgi:hypothetical protein